MTAYLGRPSLRFSIAVTLVGVLLIGAGSILGYNSLRYYLRNLRADGLVTNRWSEGLVSSEDVYIEIFRVEIQFVNEKTGKQISVHSYGVTYKIGSKIPILYDPDNPTIFSIDSGSLMIPLMIVFTLFCGGTSHIFWRARLVYGPQDFASLRWHYFRTLKLREIITGHDGDLCHFEFDLNSV